MDRHNRVLDLGGGGMHCGWLACSVGSLGKDESALVRLRFRLWSRNLVSFRFTLLFVIYIYIMVIRFQNPEVYHAKTFALSVVAEMPYKKVVDVNLMDQLRSTAQVCN